MYRTLQIAAWGAGKVAPNPMVGCVIVAQERILSEGWHAQYGEAHAEVNAITQVTQADTHLLSESTLYVSLEPCNHTGKTPPCTDLLLQIRPKKVIVCNLDPNPLVAGKGINKLREAGIEVEVGLLAKEGAILNKRFFTFHTLKRPYITLKWAMTADNFIARNDFSSKWISNPQARQLAHQWRTEEQAIMIGTNTAIYDNPRLTARDYKGENPTRIIIDKHGRIPKDHHLFDGQAPTILYTEALPEIMQDLYERNIVSVLVEGGAGLLNSLLNTGLFDEIRTIQNPEVFFQEGINAPAPQGFLVDEQVFSKNLFKTYRKNSQN